jgi:Peptidase family M28
VKKPTTTLGMAVFALALLQGSVALRAQRAPGGGSEVITEASVRGHLEFLASDALNGRGSGTRDEWIAAAYMSAQLRRWGIEPLGDDGGYIQQVDIQRSETSAPPVLSYDGGRLTHGKEMIVQSLASPGTRGLLRKFQAGMPVERGAILLMPDPMPANVGAAIAGASAVLTAETTQIRARWATLASRLPSLAAQLKGAVPTPRPSTVILDKPSYAAIAALAEGTAITLSAEVKPPQVTHTWNAIGKISGRDKRRTAEVILLTAHLDHLGNRPARDGAPSSDTIYNGADDDASGSVAVLELAEALSKGRRPKRTIIFTWFGSEEAGGYGAGYFLEHPPVPLDTIVANLEFEMIGRPDSAVPPHTLWLTGYERSDLGPRLAKRGARIVQDPHPAENFFMRSDNIQLARRGVIAQTVSSFGLHKDYHQPSDEVRLVDFPHMTEAIRSMLEPVRWLANSDYTPAWLPGKKP